jgi:hypothetical protein
VPGVKVFSVGVEAQGIVAIGQEATGVVAIGQLATGVIAIGQLARGVVAIGQLAVGVVAVGQVGIGILYGGGMLGFGALAGGLLPVGILGRLSLGDLRRGRFSETTRRSRVGPLSVFGLGVVALVVYAGALRPLWGQLFAMGGIFWVRQ